MLYFVLLFLLCNVPFGTATNFNDIRVYSIFPENVVQLQLLQEIRSRSNIIFLSEPIWIGNVVDIIVPFDQMAYMNDLFMAYGLKISVKDVNQSR